MSYDRIYGQVLRMLDAYDGPIDIWEPDKSKFYIQLSSDDDSDGEECETCKKRKPSPNH